MTTTKNELRRLLHFFFSCFEVSAILFSEAWFSRDISQSDSTRTVCKAKHMSGNRQHCSDGNTVLIAPFCTEMEMLIHAVPNGCFSHKLFYSCAKAHMSGLTSPVHTTGGIVIVPKQTLGMVSVRPSQAARSTSLWSHRSVLSSQ